MYKKGHRNQEKEKKKLFSLFVHSLSRTMVADQPLLFTIISQGIIFCAIAHWTIALLPEDDLDSSAANVIAAMAALSAIWMHNILVAAASMAVKIAANGKHEFGQAVFETFMFFSRILFYIVYSFLFVKNLFVEHWQEDVGHLKIIGFWIAAVILHVLIALYVGKKLDEHQKKKKIPEGHKKQ